MLDKYKRHKEAHRKTTCWENTLDVLVKLILLLLIQSQQCESIAQGMRCRLIVKDLDQR